VNIIFDLGKVLIDYDFKIFYEALDCQRKTISITEAEKPVLLFDAGRLSRHDFYLAMRDLFLFKADQKKFENAWKSVFFPIENMLDLAQELSRNHPVYILSNTDEIHFPFIWKQFPQLHHFGNNLMLSYELKSVKPEQEIYRRALAKFKLNPEDCIFIDDKKINVEAARNFGMITIWHQSFADTKRMLHKYLTEK